VHLLALDTSSVAISATVLRADDAPKVWSDGRYRLTGIGAMSGPGTMEIASNRHGELLAPVIENALEQTGSEFADLVAVAVGLGPGPFTGLRVGVVTAKAIGDALSIPTYGVCSLDAIAAGHSRRGEPLAVVTDARRKQVYWRLYDGANPITEPDLAPPAAVADMLQGRTSRVVGAGAELYSEVFAGFEVDQGREPGDAAYPEPAEIGLLALERARSGAPSEELKPLYLRRPDARPPGAPKQVTPV
jgi:tRNA threonylcarbamoyl adenosine modification protein YeaZ